MYFEHCKSITCQDNMITVLIIFCNHHPLPTLIYASIFYFIHRETYFLTWKDMSQQSSIFSIINSTKLWTLPQKEQYLPTYLKELWQLRSIGQCSLCFSICFFTVNIDVFKPDLRASVWGSQSVFYRFNPHKSHQIRWSVNYTLGLPIFFL